MNGSMAHTSTISQAARTKVRSQEIRLHLDYKYEILCKPDSRNPLPPATSSPDDLLNDTICILGPTNRKARQPRHSGRCAETAEAAVLYEMYEGKLPASTSRGRESKKLNSAGGMLRVDSLRLKALKASLF